MKQKQIQYTTCHHGFHWCLFMVWKFEVSSQNGASDLSASHLLLIKILHAPSPRDTVLNSTNYQLPTFTPHSQPHSHLLSLPQMAVVMTLRFSPAITKYVAGKFNVNVSMFCKYSCDASPPLSRRSCLLGRFGITCDSHCERIKLNI